MSGEEATERNRRIAIEVNAMTGMSDDASFVAHFAADAVWHLNRRNIFKQNRSVALAEWRQLAA